MENPDDKKNADNKTEKEVNVSAAIRAMCSKEFGVLDSSFLCQSLSMMNPVEPFCVNQSASLNDAIALLQKHHIGCVLVVDQRGKLVGIFTERDCMLKVVGKNLDLAQTPIADLMTRDPVAESPDTTTAFGLNLMSHGGFRHLPLVDQEGLPVGIISIKNIVDFIVDTMTRDLLNFAVQETIR